MLGAIIGDIAGSRFEWNNVKNKDFDLLTYTCEPTDDSIMSLAVAKAIVECKSDFSNLSDNAVKYMQEIGRLYPHCGFGSHFRQWVFSDNPQPYGSYGNGAAMRVSACGFAANSIEEAKALAIAVTAVTHDHPEGIKAAVAVSEAIFMAKTGKSLLEIRDYINDNYYHMNFSLDQIRDDYTFDVSCQGSVPQAFEAFFESTGFEDAIRNAISIGGDSDTIAAICGGMAEAYYGVPAKIRKHALSFLDERLLKILTDFENIYPPIMEREVDSAGAAVSRKKGKKVKGKDRASIMEEAVLAADTDVIDAESSAEETTSHKLFRHLYQCCNILRGPINQDEFKSYVTPILFFKRISDVYDEEYEDAMTYSGGDTEYAEAEDMHSFVIPEGCHWNDVREVSQDVGKAIVDAMYGIERANPDSLTGVFTSFDDATWTDKNKLTDERLKNLIEHMSLIKVGNKNYSADIMGDSYEYLIKQFADESKKNAGEFYTPRPIVKLMVNLLNPQPGDTIYDPACGTGGMLIEAISHMNSDRLAYGKIYGQENNLSTSAIARMNLYLHGAKDINIRQGDTLRNPLFLENNKLKTFDCVLANPPFGMKKWGQAKFLNDIYGRNMWGCPSDNRADYAWVMHIVRSMKTADGKAAVVLPQGVLFHGGVEGKIREQLILSDKIEAVITLASGIFYNTGVNACILFLKNKKENSHKGRICLIDGSTIFTPKLAQNVLSIEDANTLENYYRGYTDVADFCKVVTIADIENNDFDLSVNKYIEKTMQAVVPYEIVVDNYRKAIETMKVAEEKMAKILTEGGYVN